MSKYGQHQHWYGGYRNPDNRRASFGRVTSVMSASNPESPYLPWLLDDPLMACCYDSVRGRVVCPGQKLHGQHVTVKLVHQLEDQTQVLVVGPGWTHMRWMRAC